MAAINHSITEQQLSEAYQAVVAIQKQKGHNDEDAKKTADLLSYGIFRGIITLESIQQQIVEKANEVFVVPQVKGTGTIG